MAGSGGEDRGGPTLAHGVTPVRPDLAGATPLKALQTALSGMVSKDRLDAAHADAEEKKVSPGDDKVPHATDSVIAIAAKSGLGVNAGQSIQLARKANP